MITDICSAIDVDIHSSNSLSYYAAESICATVWLIRRSGVLLRTRSRLERSARSMSRLIFKDFARHAASCLWWSLPALVRPLVEVTGCCGKDSACPSDFQGVKICGEGTAEARIKVEAETGSIA